MVGAGDDLDAIGVECSAGADFYAIGIGRMRRDRNVFEGDLRALIGGEDCIDTVAVRRDGAAVHGDVGLTGDEEGRGEAGLAAVFQHRERTGAGHLHGDEF